MPPVSVCIIARNEEAHLGRCLASLASHGFELVVVDTGSTDRTKEIAASYGARVHDFVWVDDFAAARNFAAAKASHDWIFSLDCDEYVTSLDLPRMQALLAAHPRCAGVVEIDNEMKMPADAPADAQKRVYTTILVRVYSRRHYHFVGAIHEQVMPIREKDVTKLLSFELPLRLYHTGYVGTEEQIAAKNQRNVEILLKDLAQNPDDAYTYFQLGQSCLLGDDFAGACEWFAKGLSFDLDPGLEYVQTMVTSYGQSLLACGRHEEALSFTGIYDAFASLTDFVHLMGRIYIANEKPISAIGEFLKAATMPPGRIHGTNTFLSYYQIAAIYDNMGNMEIALMYYRKCGDFYPAVRRLGELGQMP